MRETKIGKTVVMLLDERNKVSRDGKELFINLMI
jgi:hypothetical protein